MVREYTKIQFRRDSSGNWSTVNPVLLAGEIGYETDTQKIKIGTGSLAWNSLAYANRPFVGDGLNYTEDGVVYADINQEEFDTLQQNLEQADNDLTEKVNIIDGEINVVGSFREGDDVIQTQVTRIDGNDLLPGSFKQGDKFIQDQVDVIDGDIFQPLSFRAGDQILKERLDAVQGDVGVTGSIKDAVAAEEQERIYQDGLLQGQITTIDGGVNVNGSFRKAVDDEEQRATGVESDLRADIATINGSGIGSIDAAVAAEAQIRSENDATLQSEITTINNTELSTGSFRAGDKFIQDQVDVIDGTDTIPGSFRNEVKVKVAAEATARNSADTTLQANINTEAASRAAGDNGLDGRLLALEGSDPGSISSQVAVETNRAVAEEARLQGEITKINDPQSGKADLVAGIIPASQLPDVAISTYLGDAISEGEMLALTGESGDWCFRTDVSSAFIAIGSDLTQTSNWKSISGPDNTNVISVNDRYGQVKITKDEFDVDHLETLTGAGAVADNLGSFTGSTIADNTSIKVALQSLETEVETKANDADISAVGKTNLYGDITGTPTLLSQFSNDLIFIDSAGAPVQKVAGRVGEVVLNQDDVGLDQVNNTSDEAKPISTATSDALALKYDASKISTFGASIIDDADAAAVRTTIGVDIANTDNSTNVTIAAGYDYAEITGASQVLTLKAIDLTTDVNGILPLLNGGTGSSTASGARTNLGVDPAGTDNSKPVSLTGAGSYLTLSNTGTNQQIELSFIDLSSQVGSSVLEIANGGTGATSEQDARTALGLGSAAVEDATTYGVSLMNAGTAAVARGLIGVDPADTDNSTDVTLVTTNAAYLSIVDQAITLAKVNLTSDVTGALPLVNGGTGSTSASGARTALELGSAALKNEADFATGAEGDLAVSALQNLNGLDTDDLSEGSSNLYYTNARAEASFDTKLGAADTDALSEGSSNLYFTDARADARITAADTDALSEGSSNLYYTDARARAAVSVSGDLSYVSSTGVFSFTQRTDAEVTTLADASAAAVTGVNLNLSSKTTDDLTEGTNKYYNEGLVDARVVAGITGKADLDSPTFTGTPAAPTAGAGTNDTQVATTAFVTAAVTALDAAALRTLLGIPTGANDTDATGDDVNAMAAGTVYYNTTNSKLQAKS